MSDDKKISQFPGRKNVGPRIATTTGGIAADQPILGGDQGTFDRLPCGTCVSWKRMPEAGLNVGTCMFFPPLGLPMPRPDGTLAQILSRSMMRADQEGCDQHDDGEEDDVEDADPVPSPVSMIKAG